MSPQRFDYSTTRVLYAVNNRRLSARVCDKNPSEPRIFVAEKMEGCHLAPNFDAASSLQIRRMSAEREDE